MGKARMFEPGDRVSLRGVGGVVTGVVRRSRPPFFGYLVSIQGAEPQEVPGRLVQEPPRPLLDEWRRWRADDLGDQYIALLDDGRLAQLQREFAEDRREMARKDPETYERIRPKRVEGVKPVHRVTVAIQQERHTNRSSNGAHERVIWRKFWWLRCPCGLHEMRESSAAAKDAKTLHENGDTAP